MRVSLFHPRLHSGPRELMHLALALFLGIVVPTIAFRRGGRMIRIAVVGWFLGVIALAFLTTGLWAIFVLIALAVPLFVIGGLTVLLDMTWQMIHFRR